MIPVDVVLDAGLQQEVSSWHEVVEDEVLVGSDRHRVAHTQRTQHVQYLHTHRQTNRHTGCMLDYHRVREVNKPIPFGTVLPRYAQRSLAIACRLSVCLYYFTAPEKCKVL